MGLLGEPILRRSLILRFIMDFLLGRGSSGMFIRIVVDGLAEVGVFPQ